MTIREMLESLNGTDAGTRVDRYAARRVDVVLPIINRLRSSDPEAFDVVAHLLWWVEHNDTQLAWREKVIGELNLRIAALEKA